MSDDFLFDDQDLDNDFSLDLNMYLESFEKGNDAELIFSEDSYDFLLDHFLEKSDLAHVENIGDNALIKYPYSGLILVKYCDALIILDNPTKALSIIEDNKSLVDEFIYLYIICRAAIHMDNFKLANDYFPKIKDASPSNGELYTFVHTLSLCLIDKNNFKDAVKFLQTLNDLDVPDYEHFNDLAFCYDRLLEGENAVYYYNLYLDNDPFNDVVWFNLGTIYARELEYDNALEAFDFSLALNKNNDSAFFNKGIVFLNLQRYREALECFESAANIDSTSVQPLLGIADSYMNMHKLEDAKDVFKKALDKDKHSLEAQIGYMCIVAIEDYKNGDREKFIKRVKILGIKNPLWLKSIISLFPELENDIEFMNIVDDICNNFEF